MNFLFSHLLEQQALLYYMKKNQCSNLLLRIAMMMISMQPIAHRIKEDMMMMRKRKTEYNAINAENLFGECSSTLITYLLKLSRFKKSCNAAMIES